MRMRAEDARTGDTVKIEISAIVGVIVLALIAAAFLRYAGSSNRRAAKPPNRVHIIGEEKDAFPIWKRSGIKGRVLIHFGGHMPIKRTKDDTAGTDMPTNADYIYAAAKENMFRKIVGVIPDSDWPGVYNALKTSKVYTVKGDYVEAWLDAMPITSGRLAVLPSLGEPVVLNFAPDYFLGGKSSPQAVLAAIEKTGLRFDLVTIATPGRRQPGASAALEKIEYLKANLR